VAVPETISYIEVKRPVLKGARDFLTRVRHIGDKVLGYYEPTTSITETALELDESLNPELTDLITPVSDPVLRVLDERDLKVSLLHKRAEKHLASRYHFPYHHNRFGSVLEPIYISSREQAVHGKRRKQTLYQQLDAVSIEHQVNPESLPITFDKVDIVHQTGKELALGLLPRLGSAALAVLQEQEQVTYLRLKQQSARLANLPGETDNLAVRFATVAADIDRHKIIHLLDRLNELPPVRFELGPPAGRSQDSRR